MSLTIFVFGLVLAYGALTGAAQTPVLEQRTQSFTIALNAPVGHATPLFGPVCESEWAPDWSPHFIHPAYGVQREGVVFTTANGGGRERLWLLTTYDVKNGRVEYVATTPALVTSEVRIRVAPDGDQHCKATITYRRSALALEGNREVTNLDARWAEQQRIHWEMAINEALAKRDTHD
jgi:hypothetical protein